MRSLSSIFVLVISLLVSSQALARGQYTISLEQFKSHEVYGKPIYTCWFPKTRKKMTRLFQIRKKDDGYYTTFSYGFKNDKYGKGDPRRWGIIVYHYKLMGYFEENDRPAVIGYSISGPGYQAANKENFVVIKSQPIDSEYGELRRPHNFSYSFSQVIRFNGRQMHGQFGSVTAHCKYGATALRRLVQENLNGGEETSLILPEVNPLAGEIEGMRAGAEGEVGKQYVRLVQILFHGRQKAYEINRRKLGRRGKVIGAVRNWSYDLRYPRKPSLD